MPRIRFNRADSGYGTQAVRHLPNEGASLGVQRLEFLHLHRCDAYSHGVRPVFDPKPHRGKVLVPRIASLNLDGAVHLSEQTGALKDFGVVRRQHAAFARADRLAALQTPGGDVSDTAARHPFVAGAVSVRAILYNGDTGLIAQRHQRIHITDIAPQMDSDNGFRVLGDPPPHILHVDQQGSRVNLAKDGFRHQHQRWGNRTYPGVGGADDLIAGAHAESEHGAVYRCRAAIERYRKLGIVPVAPHLLKRLHYG